MACRTVTPSSVLVKAKKTKIQEDSEQDTSEAEEGTEETTEEDETTTAEMNEDVESKCKQPVNNVKLQTIYSCAPL